MAGEYWRDWNVDPALNVQPPPVGAPEMGTKNKDLNDICRRIQAACRQLGDDQDATTASLKTMAFQDAVAVAITGGTLSSVDTANRLKILESVDVNGAAIRSGTIAKDRVPNAINADKLGGWTLAELFNLMYPIGYIWITTEGTARPPTFSISGVSWVKSGYSGRYLRIGAGNEQDTYPILGGTSGNVATSSAGGHAHGGSTGNTTLSIDQMPAHTHVQRGGTAAGTGNVKADAGATVANVNATGSTGGNQPHNHSITAAADHAHNINLGDSTPHLDIIVWRRAT